MSVTETEELTGLIGYRNRVTREKRRAIIEASARIFQKRGYRAASVKEICDAADVLTATFFKHFPSKEDALAAAAEDYAHRESASERLIDARRQSFLLEVLAAEARSIAKGIGAHQRAALPEPIAGAMESLAERLSDSNALLKGQMIAGDAA
jgi:AcrR family transcriptional regulator